jgi:hypothetical protein
MRVILPGVPTIAKRKIRVIVEQLCKSLFEKLAVAESNGESISLETKVTLDE